MRKKENSLLRKWKIEIVESKKDLLKFSHNRQVMISQGIKGVLLMICYHHGNLIQLLCDDGKTDRWLDVTYAADTILNIPLTIPSKIPLKVYGIGSIRLDYLEKKGGNESCAEFREFILDNIQYFHKGNNKVVEFRAYDLISDSLPRYHKCMKNTRQDFLKQNGFLLLPGILVKMFHEDREVEEAIEKMKRKKIPYLKAGVVVEDDSIFFEENLKNAGTRKKKTHIVVLKQM